MIRCQCCGSNIIELAGSHMHCVLCGRDLDSQGREMPLRRPPSRRQFSELWRSIGKLARPPVKGPDADRLR